MFWFVDDATKCLRDLAELLGEVADASGDYRYLLDQCAADLLDEDECAKAIRRLKARAEKCDSIRARIETVFGGPEHTTGYKSPVQHALDQAIEWTQVAHKMHGEGRKALLDAIAKHLDLDSAGGGL